jgi:hypothetical protein
MPKTCTFGTYTVIHNNERRSSDSIDLNFRFFGRESQERATAKKDQAKVVSCFPIFLLLQLMNHDHNTSVRLRQYRYLYDNTSLCKNSVESDHDIVITDGIKQN